MHAANPSDEVIMTRNPTSLLLCTAGAALGFALACGSGGDALLDVPAKEPAAEAPTEAPAPNVDGSAEWWLNGGRAKPDALVGAVMDLWAGDPGTICFKGNTRVAAKRAKNAFHKVDPDAFVSASPSDSSVTITTRSPFGDGETSPSQFDHCK